MVKKVMDYFEITPKGILYSVLIMTLGCIVYAYGVNYFLIPNHFGNGGVTGVSMLAYYLLKIPTGTSNFIVNAILLVVGWKYLSRRTLLYTIYASTCLSFCLNVIQPAPYIATNIIIPAVAGGVLLGAGIGLVLRGNGTTAGTDIVAMIMQQYLGISFSAGLLMCDMLVILASSFIIGVDMTIVTIMMMFIASQTVNFVTDGVNRRKSVMIFSSKKEEIADIVIKEMVRGITVFRAYGYYSKQEREVLLAIVNRNQVVQLQRLVTQIDPKAFVTISDVQQVIGEGFTFFSYESPHKKRYH
ncbi:YitT family protein [Facklamia sp. P12934]|uniref:YitT family protein n=1 Tax=unclassified Facklamia TaxID=2622293 RepID=UPI003D1759E5